MFFANQIKTTTEATHHRITVYPKQIAEISETKPTIPTQRYHRRKDHDNIICRTEKCSGTSRSQIEFRHGDWARRCAGAASGARGVATVAEGGH
ncbi:jg20432 [Pararge aegeria aegeria]|uniref:Jg20432 protein n=1 Tax=Pararge aegeria aegeria TaxID=348720 RepID=A0A8S4RXI0_9NEOP|nr:jg20432 [Pararge aegeria aegeria]